MIKNLYQWQLKITAIKHNMGTKGKAFWIVWVIVCTAVFYAWQFNSNPHKSQMYEEWKFILILMGSWLKLTQRFFGYYLNWIVLMSLLVPVAKSLLTEFGIHYRLESSVQWKSTVLLISKETPPFFLCWIIHIISSTPWKIYVLTTGTWNLYVRY